jgi:hypothetical protein
MVQDLNPGKKLRKKIAKEKIYFFVKFNKNNFPWRKSKKKKEIIYSFP